MHFFNLPHKVSSEDLLSIKKLISFENQNKYNDEYFDKKFIRENSINEFLKKI